MLILVNADYLDSDLKKKFAVKEICVLTRGWGHQRMTVKLRVSKVSWWCSEKLPVYHKTERVVCDSNTFIQSNMRLKLD